MKSDSVPAFALEKEALKTEIEAGIQTGVEQMESGQKGKKPVEKYHNTRHLLRQYRKVRSFASMPLRPEPSCPMLPALRSCSPGSRRSCPRQSGQRTRSPLIPTVPIISHLMNCVLPLKSTPRNLFPRVLERLALLSREISVTSSISQAVRECTG